MGEKSFFKPVGTGGQTRLRFRIRTKNGKIVEFVVQLEVLIGNMWKAVVRYDNAHDIPHRDVMDKKGKEVEKKLLNLGTLEEVLEYAEQDLLDRAEWYIEKFLKMGGDS